MVMKYEDIYKVQGMYSTVLSIYIHVHSTRACKYLTCTEDVTYIKYLPVGTVIH